MLRTDISLGLVRLGRIGGPFPADCVNRSENGPIQQEWKWVNLDVNENLCSFQPDIELKLGWNENWLRFSLLE